MRDTFMKVGQSLMVKKQLVNEKKMKEKMIHSVMPPKVADWLMKEGHEGQDVEELGSDDDGDVDADTDESGSMMVRKVSSPRSSNQGDIRTIFRPFNMNAMENVSILFAGNCPVLQTFSRSASARIEYLMASLHVFYFQTLSALRK
jgi:adenylate cyclase 9